MSERRRGADLENAILDAAWAEMGEKGYAGLTMEGTAARAGTSRPVLSRRWSSGQELATAAIQRELARRPVVVPDLGDLRNELLSFLQQASERADVFTAAFALFLHEFRQGTRASPGEFRATVLLAGEEDPLKIILDRGVARGEIDPGKLLPPVASLPADLFRHHVVMSMAPPSVDLQHAWIDTVFLPLVRTG
ncbi:TetR/AcrR family transcriptional regulator [Phyllobacterium sp. K27]